MNLVCIFTFQVNNTGEFGKTFKKGSMQNFLRNNVYRKLNLDFLPTYLTFFEKWKSDQKLGKCFSHSLIRKSLKI